MKRTILSSTQSAILIGLACLAGTANSGCVAQPGEADDERVEDTFQSFEEFEATVVREPDTGIYIVDGDTPIVGRDQLRRFYEEHVLHGALIVNRIGAADDRWSDAQKRSLSYCVSTAFGASYNAVVLAMRDATWAWQATADVSYVYRGDQDGNCNASNGNVVFDVRPTSGQQYAARAFFPSTGRAERNILIDASSFGNISPYTLTGILRHELGHTLGFRHEHTRPEAGVCFEDNNWRALTGYDSASVMHYPQCNGTTTGDLVLTDLDRAGAASLYGSMLFHAPVNDWGYADRRWIVDVNGDGKADFCRAVGNGSGPGSFLACSLSAASAGTIDTQVQIDDWGYADRRWMVDVNGDGKADFCRAAGNGSGPGSYLACSLSVMTSGAKDTQVQIDDWGYADRRWMADVNGDGKADFCRAAGNGSGPGSYLACSLSVMTSGAKDTQVQVDDWGYADRRWLIDFNGDHKADFCRAVGTGSGAGSYLGCSLSVTTSGAVGVQGAISDWGYTDRRWVADVNGDGKVDYCRGVGNGLGPGSYLSCALSNGAGFSSQTQTAINDWGYADRRWMADINGGGKADFLRGVGTGSGAGSYLGYTLSP